MEPGPILSSYYRLRLDDALRGRLEKSPRELRASDAANDLLFADVLTLKNVSSLPTTTQDIGEVKHGILDRKSGGNPAQNDIQIKQAEVPSPVLSMEHANRYLIHNTTDKASFRRRMEDRARRSKRAGSECPFKEENGQCSMVFIRCGNRLQFSTRESGEERILHHKCTYDWRSRGDYVLIVDDDAHMRSFCKSSFQLFMRYDEEKILTASSFFHAMEILARSKIEGKCIGLVISDIDMPGRSGYDLVNELYERNFEVEIVLMHGEREQIPEPPGYRGKAEILPNHPFVSGVLIKPFHSDRLVLEVKKLRFGWERV